MLVWGAQACPRKCWNLLQHSIIEAIDQFGRALVVRYKDVTDYVDNIEGTAIDVYPSSN